MMVALHERLAMVKSLRWNYDKGGCEINNIK